MGTHPSLTRLARGPYASVSKTVEIYRNEGRYISTKLFDITPSTTNNEQLQDNDDEEISSAAKTAATASGFHPKVCQHILDEFEKIKLEREQITVSTTKKKKEYYPFLRHW